MLLNPAGTNSFVKREKNKAVLPGVPGEVAVPVPLVELGRPAEATASAYLLVKVEGHFAAAPADGVYPLLPLAL
jgi:hypothetical protein